MGRTHNAIYVSPPTCQKNILTTKDLRVATTSNTAPSCIFAVTNSAATLPNYHTPDTAQIMIAHPSIANLLIVLPMMVQPGAASDGAAFNDTICDGNTHHDASYRGAA